MSYETEQKLQFEEAKHSLQIFIESSPVPSKKIIGWAVVLIELAKTDQIDISYIREAVDKMGAVTTSRGCANEIETFHTVVAERIQLLIFLDGIDYARKHPSES